MKILFKTSQNQLAICPIFIEFLPDTILGTSREKGQTE